ncbi:MAG: hypothetical protein KGZ86_01135 [Candidatus Latescibacteria bacterium]|nr:hypothetical protein [Candidatus Latescibacterota bacterium]
MFNRSITIFIIALILMFIGCEQKDNDVDLIIQLIDNSQYTSEGTITFDDSLSTSSETKSADSIPDWVRFVRRIERPVTRLIQVEVTGDSAVATITAYLQGNPPNYGFFVRNLTDTSLVYRRSISDSTRRRVKLYKDLYGWHIASITAWDTRTVNADPPISINELNIEVASRNYVFSLTDPDKFITRESLPNFRPGDTVKLTVTVNIPNDSSWTFLHRGRRHNYYWHIRQPLFKQSTNIFYRTYVISDENPIPPCVRHFTIDVIGWQTLYGDSLATYTARAWGLPYIVRNPTDEIPE